MKNGTIALHALDSRSTKSPETKTNTPESSFNLSLTPKQISAKDNLVLPYTRVIQDSAENPTNLQRNRILAEDFDDDDPDADLDF